MASIILTDLAPELLIHILKSTDNFADVTSLSSISRQMFIVWKTNIDVICNAILARTVPCYAQARELIDAQEQAEGDEHLCFGYQSAIDRVQWMLKEADTAAKAYVYFGNIEVGFSAHRETPVEELRMEFIKAYYRATTLATLGKDSVPLRLLLSWDLLDCARVWEVNYWLLEYCDASRQRELGVWCEDFYHKSTPTGITSMESWAEIADFLGELTLRLAKVAPNPDQDPETWRTSSASIACDHYYDSATYRGPLVADLLPLLSQKSARFRIRHKRSEAVLQMRHPKRKKRN